MVTACCRRRSKSFPGTSRRALNRNVNSSKYVNQLGFADGTRMRPHHPALQPRDPLKPLGPRTAGKIGDPIRVKRPARFMIANTCSIQPG